MLNKKSIIDYISRQAISFSVLLNTLTGGKSNQTVSATQWERKRSNKINAVIFIDALFYLFLREKDHCLESWVKWTLIHKALKNK